MNQAPFGLSKKIRTETLLHISRTEKKQRLCNRMKRHMQKHPERPERFDAVMNALARAGLMEKLLRVPSRDATALRGVLERILTDDSARRQLVAEARGHVLRFDWNEVARRTAAVYGALAAGAITPAR